MSLIFIRFDYLISRKIAVNTVLIPTLPLCIPYVTTTNNTEVAMNGLDPTLMSAHERMAEIGLILSRGIIRRLQKLKTADKRDYSLDFRLPGSIHGKSQNEGNN